MENGTCSVHRLSFSFKIAVVVILCLYHFRWLGRHGTVSHSKATKNTLRIRSIDCSKGTKKKSKAYECCNICRNWKFMPFWNRHPARESKRLYLPVVNASCLCQWILQATQLNSFRYAMTVDGNVIAIGPWTGFAVINLRWMPTYLSRLPYLPREIPRVRCFYCPPIQTLNRGTRLRGRHGIKWERIVVDSICVGQGTSSRRRNRESWRLFLSRTFLFTSALTS